MTIMAGMDRTTQDFTGNIHLKITTMVRFACPRLREGRNILQDIRSGEVQYFTGPNQNLPDPKI